MGGGQTCILGAHWPTSSWTWWSPRPWETLSQTKGQKEDSFYRMIYKIVFLHTHTYAHTHIHTQRDRERPSHTGSVFSVSLFLGLSLSLSLAQLAQGLRLFCFCFLRQSHVAQSGLKLTMWLSITLNFWSSCVLKIHMRHYAWFMWCQRCDAEPCAC